MGVDAIAASDTSQPATTEASGEESPGFWRRLFRR
jgi:hypothetical protein